MDMPINLLPMDTTSAAWRMLSTYIDRRRQELAAECCALNVSAERRQELAARIAELDELRAAPEAAKRHAEGAAAGQHTRSMY